MLHIRSQAAKRNARKLPGKELLGAAVFQSSSARQWGKVLVQLGAQWGKEKSRADIWAGDFLDFFLWLNIQSIVRSCSPPSSRPALFEYFCYVTVKYVVLYITKDMLGVSKGEGWGEWWVNTMDAVASSSTLEVLQEVLNWFFAPVLRRKSDPCRLVGNYLTRSTWSLLMSPETQGCLSNRNSAHEKTQIRTLGKVWPSGRDKVAPFRTTQTLGKSSPYVEGLLKISRKVPGVALTPGGVTVLFLSGLILHPFLQPFFKWIQLKGFSLSKRKNFPRFFPRFC